MTAHCRRGLTSIRVPGSPPQRAALLGSLLVVAWLSPSGCIRPPGSAGRTVKIDVVPGEVASGNLFGGQQLRAALFVEAGHVYNVSAGLSAATVGSTGLAKIEGVISGDPLAEPVEFSVGSSWGSGSQGSPPPGAFIPLIDGDVVIEFAYATAEEAESTGGAFEPIRALIRGPMRANYELLVIDLGLDDNGTSPQDAVALAVGIEGELTGTMNPGEDADYFILHVEPDTTYRLNLESTHLVDVTTGAFDRFGQINFGVASAGGLLISGSASAGVPGTAEFTAPVAEDVLLRLTGSTGDTSTTIQYAISVTELVPEGD